MRFLHGAFVNNPDSGLRHDRRTDSYEHVE
jgi:hypothetical protein